jgi:prevent-host-death family protein
MIISNIHEAKSRLSKLVQQVEKGEEVIIARAGKPVAKLVPYSEEGKARRGGQWSGKVHVAKDFDILPRDIAASFGLGTKNRKRNK